MDRQLLLLMAARRSHYKIGSACGLSAQDLAGVVRQCVKHTPSMFNMQSTRAIILLGEHHHDLWDLCIASLPSSTLQMRPNVAHEHFNCVLDKLETLKGGHGTVLFFEDTEVVNSLKQRYPAYSANFDIWSIQSAAIAQYAVWLAFTNSSPEIGVTLQHYYPSLPALQEKWNVPSHWKLTGQMPFGNIIDSPVKKQFVEESTLVQVYE